MEIKGKIIRVLPLQKGEGKNGPWKKQDYVLETQEKVARKVCFSLWGEKIDQFRLTEGDQAEVMFDLESREFNGRWYTDVKAWKVTTLSGNGTITGTGDPVSGPEGGEPFSPESGQPDDLPF